MVNPTAAIVVIGDEILSGRTRDANMHHLAGVLTEAGIDLREARVIADDADKIISVIQTLSQEMDYVFTSGGIGPTHDDITADCIAKAFARPIDIRDDARRILQDYYDRTGVALNEARLRMARIPDGAELIENPVSGAPGFILENVYVMAGVPRIFQAMVASVLPGLTGGTPLVSRAVDIHKGEGDIAPVLTQLAEKFPKLSIGSYPFQREGKFGSNVVVRGANSQEVDQVIASLKEQLL